MTESCLLLLDELMNQDVQNRFVEGAVQQKCDEGRRERTSEEERFLALVHH